MTIKAMPDGSNPDLGIGPGGMFGGAYPRAGFVDVPQPKKRGMFAGAEINPGNAIAGFLAGMFPQYAGSFLAPMMQRQRMEYEDQQQQRHRQDDMSDYMAKRDYEVAHPMPQQPGEFEQVLAASGIQPGTPQWEQMMVRRRDNLLDPVVMTPQGPMLRSAILNGAGGEPAPANVTFTEIPGGPTPPASGNFPGHL